MYKKRWCHFDLLWTKMENLLLPLQWHRTDSSCWHSILHFQNNIFILRKCFSHIPSVSINPALQQRQRNWWRVPGETPTSVSVQNNINICAICVNALGNDSKKTRTRPCQYLWVGQYVHNNKLGKCPERSHWCMFLPPSLPLSLTWTQTVWS